MKRPLLLSLLAAAACVSFGGAVAARTDEASADRALRSADAAFWQAFNACDGETMESYLAPDVEFYHDITGLTHTRADVTASLLGGPCGSPHLHVRREAAGETEAEEIPDYGALLTGEHLFYAQRDGEPERLATRARFLTIWKDDGGRWSMTRIVSYGHRAASEAAPSAPVELSPEILGNYAGTYRTENFGDIEVGLEAGGLMLRSGELRVALRAESPDRFVAEDRDLHFTFSGGPPATAIEVEENGTVVASGTRMPVDTK